PSFPNGRMRVGQSSPPRVSGARAEMDGLLELFVLEKAVYELKYEVDNRPDWVGIPLAGLLDAVDRSRCNWSSEAACGRKPLPSSHRLQEEEMMDVNMLLDSVRESMVQIGVFLPRLLLAIV